MENYEFFFLILKKNCKNPVLGSKHAEALFCSKMGPARTVRVYICTIRMLGVFSLPMSINLLLLRFLLQLAKGKKSAKKTETIFVIETRLVRKFIVPRFR